MENLYGALTVPYLDEGETEFLSIEDLEESGFRTWGREYLQDCFNHLVEKYEYVEESEDGYRIEQLEQGKHMEESHE